MTAPAYRVRVLSPPCPVCTTHSEAWTFRTGWDIWYPVYDRPLGPPHGPATYDPATQTYHRVFGNGTVVTFDTKTNTGEIAWAE